MPYQTPFDPSRGPFKAARYFRFSGIVYQRNEQFPADGELLPVEHKLKQLYDTRYIRYADDNSAYVTRPIPDRPADRRKATVAAGQTGGDPEVIAKNREERIAELEDKHTKAQLTAMADGLVIPPRATKAAIAALIIDAGKDSDDDGAA